MQWPQIIGGALSSACLTLIHARKIPLSCFAISFAQCYATERSVTARSKKPTEDGPPRALQGHNRTQTGRTRLRLPAQRRISPLDDTLPSQGLDLLVVVPDLPQQGLGVLADLGGGAVESGRQGECALRLQATDLL